MTPPIHSDEKPLSFGAGAKPPGIASVRFARVAGLDKGNVTPWRVKRPEYVARFRPCSVREELLVLTPTPGNEQLEQLGEGGYGHDDHQQNQCPPGPRA